MTERVARFTCKCPAAASFDLLALIKNRESRFLVFVIQSFILMIFLFQMHIYSSFSNTYGIIISATDAIREIFGHFWCAFIRMQMSFLNGRMSNTFQNGPNTYLRSNALFHNNRVVWFEKEVDACFMNLSFCTLDDFFGLTFFLRLWKYL